MERKNHYIIGDVHGEYQTLLALVTKLPKDAKLIFVGDLIDRGLQSREVVKFVRDNGHRTVMGNHEVFMIKYGGEFAQYILADVDIDINERWIRNGGAETLLSYGLVEVNQDGDYKIVKDIEAIEQLKEDIEWMKKLPLYVELETSHPSGKKVVVSHSNISKVWSIRENKEYRELFVSTTLWGRENETSDNVNIFNIYGHTPQKHGAEIGKDYANIDTGCCFFSSEDKLYGKLSAYCVESGEVIECEKI